MAINGLEFIDLLEKASLVGARASGIPLGVPVLSTFYDFVDPEATPLTPEDVERIALDISQETVRKSKRRDLIDRLKGIKDSLKNVNEDYEGKPDKYYDFLKDSALPALERDVYQFFVLKDSKPVEKNVSGMIHELRFFEGYKENANIDSLMYTYECFGEFSATHLTVLFDFLKCINEKSYSDERERRRDERQCLKEILSYADTYRNYAETLQDLMVEDRKRAIRSDRKYLNRSPGGYVYRGVYFFTDAYFGSGNRIYSETYGPWSKSRQGGGDAHGKVLSKMNEYLAHKLDSLHDELEAKIPILTTRIYVSHSGIQVRDMRSR